MRQKLLQLNFLRGDVIVVFDIYSQAPADQVIDNPIVHLITKRVRRSYLQSFHNQGLAKVCQHPPDVRGFPWASLFPPQC